VQTGIGEYRCLWNPPRHTRKLPDLSEKSISETHVLKRESAVSGNQLSRCDALVRNEWTNGVPFLRSDVPVLRINMAEASNYYVTVSVDHCIIPAGVMIRAANKDAAAQRAEMKIALQMRDAIIVKAIDVREG
jgi:hypothetical protein